MDPHLPEYLAAVGGIHDQTPAPGQPRTYATGDFVSGISKGKRWAGRIEWIYDSGLEACIDVGGGWLNVPLKDITH